MRDILATRARASPDTPALVDDGRGREWTYAELDAAVETTAGRLAALGVERGDHVGVLMETRPAFVRLAFALQRLGAVLVPLNARLAPAELRFQRERSDLVLLVCDADTEDDALDAAGPTPVVTVDDPDGSAVAALDEQDESAVDAVEWGRDDTLALMFTSGTTGDPKPVRLTFGNVVSAATASAFTLGVLPGDRWLLCLSMYHMGGLSVPLRCALYGTTCVLQRGFDADDALRALAEHDCAGVSVVPTMLRRMLRAERDFPDVRFVLCGGAPTPAELVAACERASVPVHPSYGMTEATSQIATARPAEAFANPGTVGRPVFGTTVTVVDDADDPVPAGETGELCVSGPTITPGYYDAPEANADAFGPHGLRTGDVGYRDEGGRLYVLNRRSDRIITGGENVDPGRVADATREHPAVEDVAVVGLKDDEWGERVAALVVPDADADLSRDALAAHWAERLAGFERPRTVAVVDSLPRTPSGTVDRAAARERVARASEEE
ncbi:2-succinylbenzoate-CoA ligase [Halarchaeum grantii]|uniref:2-succinylbenzoate-CoA ligase n=1 Tax=Halarchaeum grantii TaxID=1193105 RepID=A0A830EYJ2_9EURY|nr:class I adenylate-forming enzyme family protein [Halarchaeum grantii]GGL22543.1 2-succinylbenzoate-CoA ligase [Halarchaeum grantii]